MKKKLALFFCEEFLQSYRNQMLIIMIAELHIQQNGISMTND
jgi:hypothetical protein